MEKDFYRDGFEQMLKDTTEDFRMYPSRKVWHSLYNDLHPDRKWPSLAVCLVLLTAILHIGVSNNNSISRKSNNLMVASLASNEPANEKADIAKTGDNSELQTNTPVITLNNNDDANRQVMLAVTLSKENSLAAAIEDPGAEAGAEAPLMAKVIDIETIKENKATAPALPDRSAPGTMNNAEDDISASLVNTEVQEASSPAASELLTLPRNEKLTQAAPVTEAQQADREWIENFALYNQRKKNRLKPRLSMQYYITPSIGYRELFKNHDYNPANGLLQRTTQNTDDITQQAALNLEAGAAVLLDMNKKLRFKAGLQLNYSNYYTYAHELQHPTQTTVLLNNGNNNTLMPVSYSSTYGNVLGSNLNRLSNKVVQVSVPLGADYKLAGTGDIKWYMGATIQPSFLSSGEAYLISADYKNFASDASMLRRFNLSSSLETFVSFKMPSGTYINIGPQLRYQLLSTYHTQYSYTEKRYNVGFKIGLAKKF